MEWGPPSPSHSLAWASARRPLQLSFQAAPRLSKPRRPFTTQKSLLTERPLRRLAAVCPLIGKLLTPSRGILIQLPSTEGWRT